MKFTNVNVNNMILCLYIYDNNFNGLGFCYILQNTVRVAVSILSIEAVEDV